MVKTQAKPARQINWGKNLVAVEKLFFLKSAKTTLHQDDLQAILSMRVDIFYPNFETVFRGKGLSQHPLPITLIDPVCE
jgi:hypothetical protein